MTTQLHSSRIDQTLIITLSGPESHNALHPGLASAAIEILSTSERDDTVRAIILTGGNTSFCSGTDLRQLAALRAQNKSTQYDFCESIQAWVEAIRNGTKPIIAAIEGEAHGAGLALALACDLIVAGTSARFAATHAQFGLTPDAGTAWLLAQALPHQLASEMLLTGVPVDAARLQALGIVNRVVADGTAMSAAMALATTLAEQASNVSAATRQLIVESASQSLTEHFESEKHCFINSLQQRNAHEGINAIVAKRKPEFR